MNDAERVVYLEAKVEVLEEELERRSRQVRRFQELADRHALVLWSRLESGLPPLPRQAYDLELWRETTEWVESDVETTMEDLWRSLG